MIMIRHVPLVDGISCAHSMCWLKSVVVISSGGELTHYVYKLDSYKPHRLRIFFCGRLSLLTLWRRNFLLNFSTPCI